MTSRFDCEREVSAPTERAVDEYRVLFGDLVSVTEIVGTREQLQVDSVFSGETAFAHLDCESGDCDDDFLRSIELFREARERSIDARDGFELLQKFVSACDVKEPELFREQSQTAIAKADKFVTAFDHFLASAKRHVDEELGAFRGGEHFQKGMDAYEDALAIDPMDPEELRLRATVYNSEE